MFLVYMAVCKVEEDAEKYTFARYTSSKKKNMIMSRRVMVQGILYSAALVSLCFITFLVAFIRALDSSYAVDFLASILLPLQGFWNAMIYLKPQIEKMVKKICKTRKNVSDLTQDNQNTSSKKTCCWWTKLQKKCSWIQRKRSWRELKGSRTQQVDKEVQDESKKGVELGYNNGVGVLKVNSSKQEEQIMDKNANDTSSLLNSRKKVMFEDSIKGGDDSNAVTTLSSLMLSCVEQEEEASEALPFTTLSQNSEMKEEEQSQLEYFTALEEVNTEYYDNIDDGDSDSDDDSDVDDYLRMMSIEW